MPYARPTAEPRGQIVVVAAAAFLAILAVLALLFDSANAMVMRRDMQDAGDAAAVAAANVLHVGTPRGCSGTEGGPPRASIAQAARDSLAVNLTWFDASTAVISCPTGYENQAVAVDLDSMAPRFFAGFVGGQIRVTTQSSAVNRFFTGSRYSVVQLDPWNPSWPTGRRGCPSVLLSGGPTVTLEASMHVNSRCPAVNGGALATNGSAATLTMSNGSPIRLVGGYQPGSMTISPAPITGVEPVEDPLARLPPVDRGPSVPVYPRAVLGQGGNSNEIRILNPGIYRGGIELRSQSVALLRPGIYVLEGGGLQVGAQARLLAVSPSVVTPNFSNWAGDCPIDACGVLIFNTSGAAPLGPITFAAGSTIKLRAYDLDAMGGTGIPDFEDILLWQDANPVPTISYEQPIVSLKGGGNVDIRGTVYAPSAKIEMGGNSGGSGGDSVNLTLQFISWDLELRGNSSFTFYFSDEDFARPLAYGLVE